MSHDTLKWNPNAKLYSSESDQDWFSNASFSHFLNGIVLYIYIKYIFNLNDTSALIISNILHIIEDYLENKSTISLEGFISKIANCKNDLYFGPVDHDSLQNFLGDNISNFLGSIVGMLLYNTDIVKNNINGKILIIFLIIWILGYILLCRYIKQ